MHHERLEPRRLLSATFSNGVLTITGTASADYITLSRVGEDHASVSYEIRPRTLFQSQAPLLESGEFRGVKQLIIQALGGNDDIRASDKLRVPTKTYGGSGNDYILMGYENDVIYGEAGDDEIDSSRGNDAIFGGSGNDNIWITREGGAEYVEGQDGFDALHFSDPYYGATATITYSKPTLTSPVVSKGLMTMHKASAEFRSVELIDTTGGDDNISVVVKQGAYDWYKSSDYIHLRVYAGKGNDKLSINIEDNRVRNGIALNGGEGNDTIDGSNSKEYLHFDGSWGNDVLRGGSDNDTLIGNVGNDALFGFAGYDSLYGDDGNDYLEGGSGDDLLVGGTGNDTLHGGYGSDRMYGEAGNDTFYARDSLKDRIFGGDDYDTLVTRDSSETAIESIEKYL